uniref:Uncharacterized protein n=1 Tax=Lysinibacillus sphaericus TaxID=1421 RepID=B5A904_LYSSH|nr:unknown [Lysinibacillus sphaericus]ACF35652.1 unknown [Lysinibacillus sphaericus]
MLRTVHTTVQYQIHTHTILTTNSNFFNMGFGRTSFLFTSWFYNYISNKWDTSFCL